MKKNPMVQLIVCSPLDPPMLSPTRRHIEYAKAMTTGMDTCLWNVSVGLNGLTHPSKIYPDNLQLGALGRPVSHHMLLCRYNSLN